MIYTKTTAKLKTALNHTSSAVSDRMLPNIYELRSIFVPLKETKTTPIARAPAEISAIAASPFILPLPDRSISKNAEATTMMIATGRGARFPLPQMPAPQNLHVTVRRLSWSIFLERGLPPEEPRISKQKHRQ